MNLNIKGILFAALLAIGCGASQDGHDEPEDVGTAEQELRGNSTTSFGYGFTTGATHPNCLGATAPSGQQCIVPQFRTIFWCTDTGLASHNAAISAHMNAVIAGIGIGWTFVHQQDGATCARGFAPGGVHVLLTEAAASCSGGSTSTNIDSFVCHNPTPGAPLNESLPGTYAPLLADVIIVDIDDINLRASAIGPPQSVTTIAARIERHGLGHALAAVMGLGSRTDVGASNSYTRRSVLPIMGAPALTVGEKCRANNFSESNPTTYTITAALCSAD